MQQRKETGRGKYLDLLMIALGVLVLIELIVMCMYQPVKSNDFSIVKCQKMENIFDVSWGDQRIQTTLTCMIDNPDMDTIYVSTVLHKGDLGGGDSILFRSRQSGAKVYLDDELIYDTGASFDYPFLLGYGSFWRSVRIGDNYEGKTLTIAFEPLYALQAVSGYIPDVYCGMQSSFMIKLFQDGFWYLLLAALLMTLGIALVIYGIVLICKRRAYQIFFLGLFSADMALWMLMETHILEMFIQNIPIIIYLTLSTYGMMPVLLVRFLLSYDEFKNKIYLKVLYLVGCVLNIAQLLLAMAGICSQFESQGLNRIYLGLTVVGLLLTLSSARSVEKGKRELYSGILVLAVSTVLELVYFLLIDKKSSGRILILGVCLFIIKSGIDLLRRTKAVQRTDLEQEFITNMGYTDPVTHMGNRYAYDQEKDRLEGKSGTHITILIADMYGDSKAEGRPGALKRDPVIGRMADLMSESFQDMGRCYRIAEDEFCILAENVERQVFESGIRRMEEGIAALQQEIPGYGMAYGIAEGLSDEIEEIFHTAGDHMYIRKKEKRRKSTR